jgi:hypothetical protein
MCREYTENGATVVYLTAISGRWYLPTREELESACPIQASHRLADGTIYIGQWRESRTRGWTRMVRTAATPLR